MENFDYNFAIFATIIVLIALTCVGAIVYSIFNALDRKRQMEMDHQLELEHLKAEESRKNKEDYQLLLYLRDKTSTFVREVEAEFKIIEMDELSRHDFLKEINDNIDHVNRQLEKRIGVK